MKKYICLFLCLFTLLCSCSTSSYERDTTAGMYERISYSELKEKVNNKEDFFVIFTQKGCTHCKEYKDNVLSPYLKTHNVTVYEFILSNEENYSQELFTEIQNYTVTLTKDENKQFLGTPYSMVVQDGTLKEGISGPMIEKDLEEIIKKYQLDAKREYRKDVSEGSYIGINFKTLQEKIENDDSFMVIYTQNFCDHCAEYKEMLTPYLQNHNIDIFEFVMSNEENYGQAVYDSIVTYTNDVCEEEIHEMLGTPYTAIIRAGNLVEGFSGPLTEKAFQDIVEKYRMDELKEK